jgi:multidrug resistance efflux pump
MTHGEAPSRLDAPAAPPRRRFTRTTKIGTTIVVIVTLLEVAGLATRWFLTDRVFVIADNAQVDGDQVDIRAPVDGLVVDWRIGVGSRVVADQVVGAVEIQGTSPKARRQVRAPGSGTVAQSSVARGTYVTAGALLAIAYDGGGAYVTARVPEDDVGDVRTGAPVDVLVDAAPGAPLTGEVTAVDSAASGVNQLATGPWVDPLDRRRPVYPGADTDPRNIQRVEQYVPVHIRLTRAGDARIVPGMNVTVHIHKQ